MGIVEYGASLPPLSTVTFEEQGSNLWAFLLSAEKAATAQDQLVGIRVLGQFLADFWDHRQGSLGIAPYKRLCLEISNCIGMTSVPVGSEEVTRIRHNKLWDLGLMYRNYIMRERILKAIGDAQKSKSDARDIALFRDGYKCMLSGLLDIPSRKSFPELKKLSGQFGYLQAAHLFSESAREDDKNYAAAAFAMLQLFQLEGQAGSILGGTVNDPQNILTLEYSLYRMFDHLDIWLEEVVNMPHTYDIIVPPSNQDEYNGLLHRPPSRVTFTITDDVLLKCKQHDTPLPALPDPKLIALRASSARVAHLSGAAEQMDQITRETEEATVLAEDGSSASLLGVLLGLQSNHVEDGT